MKYYVLWFNVAVDNLLGVQLPHRLADLPHVPCCLILLHRVTFLKQLEKLSAHAQLQDDVDVGHIVEVPIHFDDVGVIEEQLDLQLPYKLLCYLFLPQQTLLHNLDRANKATHFFPNQEHLPILALPQFLNLLEIHN